MPAKLYLLIITILVTPLLCLAQNNAGELKGTIKYQTANGLRGADAGAEVIVYLIDSVRVPSEYRKQHDEDSIINNSFLATIYYDEWEHSPIHKTQKQMMRKLKDIDAYPEEKLHDLDNTAATIIKEREHTQCAKTTADNNGNYSVKLHTGYYGIIFRSRHLHTHTKAESTGDILLDDVWIKPGQTITKNKEML